MLSTSVYQPEDSDFTYLSQNCSLSLVWGGQSVSVLCSVLRYPSEQKVTEIPALMGGVLPGPQTVGSEHNE